MLRVTARWANDERAVDRVLTDDLAVEFSNPDTQLPFALAVANALRASAEFHDIKVEKLMPTWEPVGL
jgi:hypothetical protein